jgi:ADP-ribose pyrophosphatase YjhB (NUDIX family)
MADTLRQATLLFLLKDDLILLAMKKRGFGAGRWNGVGGKPDEGETIDQAAIRECREEIGVSPRNIRQVAALEFYFPPHKASFNQEVIVYTATEWEGEPAESDEMKPQWYAYGDIPYDDMWSDDKIWLPEVLKGNFVNATFEFDDNDHFVRQTVAAKPLT